MDLEKIEKQWNDYNEEFDNSDYMDIENHISMADKVGVLLPHAKKLEKIIKLSKVEDMSIGEFGTEVLRIIEGRDIPSRNKRN